MSATLDWPLTAPLDLAATALLAIDMQGDFIGRDGWFDQIGIKLAPARSAIKPLKKLLQSARKSGILVAHTREGYRACGGDIAANIKWRSAGSGLGYGDLGKSGRVLTRGETGWGLVEELSPLETEPVIDKPGKSAFWGTGLDHLLRSSGIRFLIISGVTTDVCVQTTFREAADLGYDCILVTDASAASKVENHQAYLDLLQSPCSSVGPIASSDEVITLLEKANR